MVKSHQQRWEERCRSVLLEEGVFFFFFFDAKALDEGQIRPEPTLAPRSASFVLRVRRSALQHRLHVGLTELVTAVFATHGAFYPRAPKRL